MDHVVYHRRFCFCCFYHICVKPEGLLLQVQEADTYEDEGAGVWIDGS